MRILLVDDHAIVTDGLEAILQTDDSFEVVEKHNSANFALAWLKTNDVELMITDYSMPDMSGLELVRKVKTLKPAIKILVLSMHDEPVIVREMLAVGVDAYVLKKYAHQELVNAIHAISNGRQFWSAEINKTLLNALTKSEAQENHITDRELDVLKLIVQELTSKQIAEKLFISERTVETHRKNLMRKTGVNNVIGLVRYAYAHKLI